MTYDERITAFALRLQGKPWSEIAAVLHYSPSVVRLDIKNCIAGKKYHCPCIYPAITEVLVRNYCGSICALARSSGIPYSTLYSFLTGRSPYSPRTAKKLSAFLGMSPGEAFKKG